MDWFSWLSKTHLEPPYINEYAKTFSNNQLEEEDISYFNHEFLQSMGISIAKHRLEILKLSKKSSSTSHPMAKLMLVFKKTKRTLANLVRTWVHRNDSAMVMVKRRTYSSRWKGAMVKRSNRLVMNKQWSGTLLLTNGYRPVVKSNNGGAKVNSFSSPLVYDIQHDEKKENGNEYKEEDLYSDYEDGNDGDEYWSTNKGGEDIKWDAMFQNLKPT
uniref:uncharacterized protein LOC122579466 n=1 Tax=Erigeron canadensis TaxID=72917 RepID=UPI001CB96DC3|nr:uncharacterized protein LOC122579466 [Erigeron canadensis]